MSRGDMNAATQAARREAEAAVLQLRDAFAFEAYVGDDAPAVIPQRARPDRAIRAVEQANWRMIHQEGASEHSGTFRSSSAQLQAALARCDFPTAGDAFAALMRGEWRQ